MNCETFLNILTDIYFYTNFEGEYISYCMAECGTTLYRERYEEQWIMGYICPPLRGGFISILNVVPMCRHCHSELNEDSLINFTIKNQRRPIRLNNYVFTRGLLVYPAIMENIVNELTYNHRIGLEHLNFLCLCNNINYEIHNNSCKIQIIQYLINGNMIEKSYYIPDVNGLYYHFLTCTSLLKEGILNIYDIRYENCFKLMNFCDYKLSDGLICNNMTEYKYTRCPIHRE